MTPRERVRALVHEAGDDVVVRWCAGLLGGSIRHDDPRWPALVWLGGPHAESLLRDHPHDLGFHEYWPRVWAARGLMYVWTPDAQPAVRRGLKDGAWRVREMSAKVVRAREVTDAEKLLVRLLADEVPRVRAAAVMALARVGEVEHRVLIERQLHDEDATARRAAQSALAALRKRLEL